MRVRQLSEDVKRKTRAEDACRDTASSTPVRMGCVGWWMRAWRHLLSTAVRKGKPSGCTLHHGVRSHKILKNFSTRKICAIVLRKLICIIIEGFSVNTTPDWTDQILHYKPIHMLAIAKEKCNDFSTLCRRIYPVSESISDPHHFLKSSFPKGDIKNPLWVKRRKTHVYICFTHFSSQYMSPWVFWIFIVCFKALVVWICLIIELFITNSADKCNDVDFIFMKIDLAQGKKLHGGSGRFRPQNAKKSPRKLKKSPWKLP